METKALVATMRKENCQSNESMLQTSKRIKSKLIFAVKKLCKIYVKKMFKIYVLLFGKLV